MKITNIDLIAAPFGEGAGVLGSEKGPAMLMRLGLAPAISHESLCIHQFTEIVARVHPYVPQPNLKCGGHTIAYNDQIFLRCSRSFREGNFPLPLAGDHSLSIGSILAAYENAKLAGKKFICLYVDAHTDFNTPDTTPSGNTHGMTIAAAAGLFTDLAVESADYDLDLGCMVYYGARDIDHEEQKLLDQHPEITVIDMKDPFHLLTLMDLLDERIDDDTYVHVSFDVDSLDPDHFRATGLNVPDGLRPQDVETLFHELRKTEAVKSLDVVEYNPSKDNATFEGGQLVNRLVSRLFHNSR